MNTFLPGNWPRIFRPESPPAELRGTTDIEFGIALESRQQLEVFQKGLIATGEFVAAKEASGRLFYVDGDLYEDSQGNRGWVIQVDFIPFIGTPGDGRMVASPASRESFMNASGPEVLQSSFSIEVEEGLTIRVASLSGLTLMDLTAWVCLGTAASEAVTGLARVLNDCRVGNEDLLWEQHGNLLEAVQYDQELARAALHGREVASICEARVLHQIRSFLTIPANRRRLAGDASLAFRELIASHFFQHRTEASLTRQENRMAEIVGAFCFGLVGCQP